MDSSESSGRTTKAPQREPDQSVNDTLTPMQVENLRHLLDQAEKDATEARRCVSLLNAIVNVLPVGVVLRGKDGQLLLANDTAATQFSIVAEDSVGDPPAHSPLAADPIHTGNHRTDLISSGLSMATEHKVIGPNGERRLLTLHKPVHIFGYCPGWLTKAVRI
jgi:PAS domain-containing protein